MPQQENFRVSEQAPEAPNTETLIKNFIVYSMHQTARDLAIQVPFNPNHVFIVNQTAATLYLMRGGQYLPNNAAADLIILPNSYYNFKPNFGGYLYAAHLEFPPGSVDTYPFWQCQIMFYEGAMNMALLPKPETVTPLNPLPPGEVGAVGFDVDIQPLSPGEWCNFFDFTLSDGGFLGTGMFAGAQGTYLPGVGWESVLNGAPGTFQQVLTIVSNPAFAATGVQRIEFTYFDPNASGTVTRAVFLRNAAGTTLQGQSDNVTVYGAQSAGFDMNDALATERISVGISNSFAAVAPAARIMDSAFFYGVGADPGLGESCILPGARVTFTPITTGVIASYLWFFGDGDISNDPMPTHDYAADGVYTVTMCVYGLYGGFDCVSADLYINAYADVYNSYY